MASSSEKQYELEPCEHCYGGILTEILGPECYDFNFGKLDDKKLYKKDKQSEKGKSCSAISSNGVAVVVKGEEEEEESISTKGKAGDGRDVLIDVDAVLRGISEYVLSKLGFSDTNKAVEEEQAAAAAAADDLEVWLGKEKDDLLLLGFLEA